MASIGALIIDLVAKTGNFETDLGRAARAAEKRSKEIDSSISKLGSRIAAGLGAVVAGFSFAKIIEETAESEAAFSALDNAVRNNAGAAGTTTKELEELSGQLQRMTTYSDDAVQGAQALLLSFRQIRGDQFDLAQIAVLDLATALKKDLSSAATLVGRALADPEKGMAALSRAGVVLSDSQKKLVKDLADSGKLAEAQSILLKELEARFGGAAEAARNNFSGALIGVKNAFGNLLEVRSGLPGAVTSLNKLAEVLQDPRTKAAADSLFSGLISAGTTVIEVLDAIAEKIGYITDNSDRSIVFRWAKEATDALKITGTELDHVRDDIKFLQEALDSGLPGVVVLGQQNFKPDSILGVLTKNEIVDRLKELNREAAKLEAQMGSRSSGSRRRGRGPDMGAEPVGETEEFRKAREEIEKLIASTRAQAKASDEGAEAAIRFRLTQGDLADEMKILGVAGEKLAGQLIQASRALDISKAVDQLDDFNKSLKAQTEGLADNEAQAIRYRLEFGDLAEAVKRAGAAGKDLKLQIIASADAKQQKEDLKDIETGLMAINAQILEFQNRQDEGALLKFDKENADLVLTLRRQGDEAGLKQIETLRKLVGAQAQINQLNKEAAVIREEESANEDRIRNSLEAGAITELDAMRQLDDARKKAISDLDDIYQKQKLIADASGSETLVEGTKKFAHEIANLKAQTDLLAKNIRSGLVDASSDAFTSFVTGAQSAGDALDSFLKDIERQLVELAAKQLFQKIFSTGDASSGGGGWIAAIAGLFGGGRATGGPVDAGTMYRVNERGPEYFKPNVGGKVVPLSKMPSMGGMSVVNHFNIQAPQGTVSRQTEMQIGARVAKSIQAASGRNN